MDTCQINEYVDRCFLSDAEMFINELLEEILGKILKGTFRRAKTLKQRKENKQRKDNGEIC